MADAKGTGVVFLKNKLKAEDGEAEVTFIRQLSEEIRNIYFKSLSISWVPVEAMATMMETAAKVVYPGDPQGIFKIGQDEARDNLNGIYKVLLRITTVPFLIQQTAKLWRSYHAAGEARARFEKGSEQEGVMIVSGYSAFPAVMREVVRGYIHGALELTRAQNIRVTLDETDPENWTWHCRWE